MAHNMDFGEDRVTVEKLLIKFVKLKRYALLNKKRFIIAFLVGGIIGFLVSLSVKPNYKATVTFMTTNQARSTQMGLMKIASDLGAFSSSEELDAGKLVELIYLPRIIQDALLQKAVIDSSEDFLANHYIRIFKINEVWKDYEWKGKKILSDDFMFNTNDRTKFKSAENIALKILYNQLRDKIKAEYSRKGVITLEFESLHEEFSKTYSEKIVETLSEFYITKSIEQQLNTYNNLLLRLDTIQEDLNKAENKLARFKDESRQLVKAQGYMKEIRLKREVELLSAIYVEVSKNIEIAKFSLLDKTPIIQVIDKPALPLIPTKIKKRYFIALGSFGLLFLVLAYYFIRREMVVWKNYLKEAEQKYN